VPPTPDAQRIDAVELVGPKALHAGDVKERLVSTPSSWLPAWVPLLGRVEWFDPSAWQADLRRITRYYEAHGFYQVRITEEGVTETKPGHVKLLVKLKEGDPARVASLQVVGLSGLPPELQAELGRKLPVQVGDIFLEDAWVRAKVELGAALREAGWAEAKVEGDALVDADAAKVDLSLTVTAGQRYRVGRLLAPTTTGAQVPSRLIRDVVSTEVKEGDWFSESALAQAQARVFQMGVFGAVRVTRGAPEPDTGTVPLVIDTREAPFHTLRAGFGLGGDLVHQDVHLTGEYVNRNLGLSRLVSPNALLDKLTLKVKLGWAFLPTVWDVALKNPDARNGPTGMLSAAYEVPRVFGLHTVSFQGGLDVSRALDAAFDYYGGELKLGFLWRPRVDLSVVPSLNFDAYFLNADIAVSATAPSAAIGCPRLPNACIVSYFETRVELDRRDDKLEPKQGFYAALAGQAGLASTTQLTPYLRLVPDARGYVSFGKNQRFTLAGKVRLGTLLAPGNQTPIVARFFSGGSDMRGFNQRRLSPMVAEPVLDAKGQPVIVTDGAGTPVAYQGQAVPIGGSGLLEASLELRWALTDDLVLAVFTDWGSVSWEPLGTVNPFDALYAAVGLGLRYRTVLGPIRADVAFRLPMVGNPQRLFASTGPTSGSAGALDLSVPSSWGCFVPFSGAAPKYSGSPEGLCAFHLSIGEAF
jgi:translocation and assembly module TamA